MAFTLSIDDFVISLFVAPAQFHHPALYIYAMVKRGISPQINALSTCMMLVTVSLVVISQLLQKKGYHSSRKD